MDLQELEKELAVHQAECAGRYAALEAKLDGLTQKLGAHMESTQEYRDKTLAAATQTRQLLLYGFIGLVVTMVLGPENGMKLLAAMRSGGGG